MQMFYLFLLIVIISGFIAFVYFIPKEQPTAAYDDARQLITQFTKSGEYIAFDVNPPPPETRFTYQPRQQTTSITLENGTIINKTEVVYEQVEQNTTISLYATDRTLGKSLICRLGHHCDITGTINLIDPTTNKRIRPPYSYLITINCDYRDWCNLITQSSYEVSFPDGTFKYTWLPTSPVNAGEYEATLYVTSDYTNEKGENERRIASRMIQVIE